MIATSSMRLCVSTVRIQKKINNVLPFTGRERYRGSEEFDPALSGMRL
jgi:hypothetical protein